MACLSPSPSGRRLSELLEEKQEPFFLDLHLLEKGCSSRHLDGYDTALCWPGAGGGDAAAVLRRLTSRKTKTTAAGSRAGKQRRPGGGILRLLLSRILHGKAAGRKPAALQFSDSFKMASTAAVAPSPCSSDSKSQLDAVVLQGDVDERRAEYSDSDSDDEKQLSPVSVLEHPFESSPVHSKLSPSKNAMHAIRELLDAAYSAAAAAAAVAAGEDDDECYYSDSTSPKSGRRGDDSATYWEAQSAELARVSELVASELPVSRLGAADVLPEHQDVGAELEAAVIEALLQELVLELGGC